MYDKPKAHFWEPNIIARTGDAFWYSPIADAAAPLSPAATPTAATPKPTQKRADSFLSAESSLPKL